METIELTATDTKMLELINILKQVGSIRFKQEFYDALEVFKQNELRIKTGKQHFTAEQVARACKAFNVNANWIMGLEPNVFRKV